MIRLEKINKFYRTGGEPLHVLCDVELDVGRGEFVSIMGASGSGKSTLLNILGILDGYDSGSYYFDGTLLKSPSEREAARYRNRLIGFVFQSFNLLGFKTAVENVALPLYYQGVSRRERTKRALRFLERVGLTPRANHLPSELSGGERQRVAVARALVTEPKLVLADEPTGALDSSTSHELMTFFREVNRGGVTIIVVTHESAVAAASDRVIHIKDGKVQAN